MLDVRHVQENIDIVATSSQDVQLAGRGCICYQCPMLSACCKGVKLAVPSTSAADTSNLLACIACRMLTSGWLKAGRNLVAPRSALSIIRR